MSLRVRLTATILALVAASAPRVSAAEGLELEPLLAKSGVQLVAVEFWATTCAPCVKAAPRWKAFHERHRREGLRLVTVAVEDPSARTTSMPWSPDQKVYDDSGELAKLYGVSGSGGRGLPSAFLWSWRGELLVSGGKLEDVERAAVEWLGRSPVVGVHVQDLATGSGLGHKQLWNLLRQDLQRRNKLRVALTEVEEQKIRELRARARRRGAGSGARRGWS